MELPLAPIVLTDVVGSSLVIVLSLLCVREGLRLKRRDGNSIVWTYLLWLSIAFATFGISRGLGHVVKHGLLAQGMPDAWASISPVSGGLNTMTFVAVGTLTLYFGRVRRHGAEREERVKQLQVLDRVLRHNIHNDMNLILGNASVLEEETGRELSGRAGEIRRVGESLLETVDKERDIVELLAEPVSMEELDVVEVARLVKSRAERDHPAASIHLEAPESAPVEATGAIGRGIRELVENAIQHHDGDEPEVEITISRREKNVLVEISDDGPGIPEDEVAVLTRTYAIDPLFHGSGLGLWLVHWIVKRSRGYIEFAENEPRGSRVEIHLRAADGE